MRNFSRLVQRRSDGQLHLLQPRAAAHADAEPEDGSVKIDHKVWFSVERTTIQWLKMGIEVGGVGLALAASGRAEFEATGVLLLVPGLGLFAAAAAQYHARHVALRRQDADVLRHATRVPLVITCVLTATVVTNFAFAVWRAAAAAEDEAARADGEDTVVGSWLVGGLGADLYGVLCAAPPQYVFLAILPSLLVPKQLAQQPLRLLHRVLKRRQHLLLLRRRAAAPACTSCSAS